MNRAVATAEGCRCPTHNEVLPLALLGIVIGLMEREVNGKMPEREVRMDLQGAENHVQRDRAVGSQQVAVQQKPRSNEQEMVSRVTSRASPILLRCPMCKA